MIRLVHTLRNAVIIVLFLVMLGIPRSVQADMAPPEQSPGSNPFPGGETTQVQMVAEKVILTIVSINKGDPFYANNRVAAKVSAHFDMKNQGSSAESMQARFPLMNPSGHGDGYGNFPEIKDLKVKNGGKTVPTTKISTPNPYDSSYPDVTWAAFDVTFPVGQDVNIDVTYTLDATGYTSFVSFTYILETGAGWKDSIGTADIIVHLPYAASNQNVLEVWAITITGWKYEGNDIHWHLENFEPQVGQNIVVAIVDPSAWQGVLDARQAVEENPKDGNLWGTLAHAYKGAIYQKFLRGDAGGLELYHQSVEAYEQAITLLPQVSRWHAGYAELLWYHYFQSSPNDQAELVKIVQELKTALELDAGNTQASYLLSDVCWFVPSAVSCQDSHYQYLILTATIYDTLEPTATPSETPVTPASPTPSETVKPTLRVTLTPTIKVAVTGTLEQSTATSLLTPAAIQTIITTPTSGSKNGKPLCASALLLPFVLVIISLRALRICVR